MYKRVDNYNLPVIENLKRLIWVYFILLVFEGALRKWFLPGLSTPLLIVRDPIALWIIYLAWKHNIVRFNIYVILLTIIAVISFFTAIFWGHGNLYVAIFGVRSLILHFPLIFIIGAVFNRDDVIKLGKFIIYITIPMTVLLVLQFYSPQSSWVNRGVGGDTAGAGFTGALGFFRPPATFSFSSGTTSYYGFAACFVLYFLLSAKKYINSKILLLAGIAVLLSIPFSISRSLFFSIIVTAAFIILAVSRKPKNFVKVVLACMGVLLLFLVLTKVGLFKTANEAFTDRLSGASEQEGGISGTLLDRYLGGMLTAIVNSSNVPFWGYGIGMGTNVGSLLLSGKIQFLISEGEWGRLIGELGVLLGLSVIVIRITVSIKIAVACYRKLTYGDLLPWVLLSYCLLTLPQSQWGQPTSLGFSILGAGVAVASLRSPQTVVADVASKPINH